MATSTEFVALIEGLKDAQVTQKDKLELLNKLVEYSEKITDFSDPAQIEQFVRSVRVFVVHPTKALRTASLRVMRYYMRHTTFINVILKHKLHFFIARSLERDKHSSEAERMQSLKLVRKMMELNVSLLPSNIVHGLVSIAEHPEDSLCRVAVETLCELAIRCPVKAAHCSAIKVLLNAILEPNYVGIQESLILSLIYLLNEPQTRVYIRNSLDAGILLAPLTDNFNVKESGTSGAGAAGGANAAGAGGAGGGVGVGGGHGAPSSGAAVSEKEKKWMCSIRALSIMLKSWTGLIVLASHPLGLKAVVDALRLPCHELHDRLLDALFDIFRLSVNKNSNPFLFSAQSHAPTDESTSPDMVGFDLPSRTRGERHNLLNNYLSALLIAFIDCGLIEALILLGNRRRNEQVVDKEENGISIKATLLLGELLYLTNSLLPASQCALVQTLPLLVSQAASFTIDPRVRSRASSMVTNLHQYHHLKHASSYDELRLSLIVTGANKWKRVKGRDRRLDRMDEVKIKIDFQMDFDQLKNKIQETQVLATKDYQKWKWDVVSDLLEGPFNNPQLVKYAIEKTKFMARIFSFYRPSQKAFSKMPWSTQDLKYVRMACQLLEVLVSSDVGKEYLRDNNKLIPEITEMLALELERSKAENPSFPSSSASSTTPTAGTSSSKSFLGSSGVGLIPGGPSGQSQTGGGSNATSNNTNNPSSGVGGGSGGDTVGLGVPSVSDGKLKELRLLSQEQVLKTMAREYFTMLGTLSSSARGLDILQKYRLFKYLIELSELQGRDDLCHLIMTSLDYNIAGDSRVILSKALNSPSKVVRFLATRHMKVLLRAGVQDYAEWGVEMLVKQLNDPDIKVAQVALGILDEACDDMECMESVIAKKPLQMQLLRMGQLGKNLWLRFLSTPSGFQYLSESNQFIAQELQLWKSKWNVHYVNLIENALAETFSPSIYKQRESEQSGDGVFLPPHFYGELAKTKEGCDVLEQSGHIPEFISIAQNQNESTLERRAVLWALGHIGSCETGFEFLEKVNAVGIIASLAEHSPCLSIRGTCFYVLGMLSRVEKARAALYTLGWESPNNWNACISAPKSSKTSAFFKLPAYQYEGSFAVSATIEYPVEQLEIRQEILKNVSHLSNFISAESASRALKRIKSQHPEHFTSASLMMHVFQLLSTYKFRLPVRRFIYEIFDGVVWNDEVLEQLSSSSTEPVKQ